MEPPRAPIYTIGHSNLPTEAFIGLLDEFAIEVVADVRSQPVSRLHPQYNREPLAGALRSARIRYAFLGNELGGRPADTALYDDAGHVDYMLVAGAPRFVAGVERLEASVERYRVALLCAEEDPRACHRHLLVARVLRGRGWNGDAILHIRADGSRVSDTAIAHQMMLPEVGEWRSPRSVSPRPPPSTSSGA